MPATKRKKSNLRNSVWSVRSTAIWKDNYNNILYKSWDHESETHQPELCSIMKQLFV